MKDEKEKIIIVIINCNYVTVTMVLNVSASDNNYEELGVFKSAAELMEYFTDSSVPASKQEILFNKL